jgi:hypothetical protein
MTGPPRYVLVGTTVDGLTPHERARRKHVLDRWLIAGTLRQRPYPCMCRARRGECTKWCSCWGRLDHLDLMPEFCCGRRLAEASAAAPDIETADRQKAA